MKNKKHTRLLGLIREYNKPVNYEIPSIFDEIVPTEEVEDEEVEEINPYPTHHISFRPNYKNRETKDWEKRAYKIVNKLRDMNISAKNLKRMVYEELLSSIGDAMPKDYFQ